MDQLGSLPAWAQQEIRTLKEQVSLLRSQLGVYPESNTTYGVNALSTKHNLPHESYVQFYEQRHSSRYIEAHMCEQEKALYLASRQPLIVVPVARHCVRVKLE